MDNVETWDEDVRKKLGAIPSAKAENSHHHQQHQQQQIRLNYSRHNNLDYAGLQYKKTN